METARLFDNNAYLRECEATIIACRYEHMSGQKSERMCIIELDRTVFFPEGGGQSSDTGILRTENDSEHPINVFDVQVKDGHIYHYTDAEPDKIKPGTKVTAEINWDKRFDNMQRHLGEHIFSGAAFRLYGLMNKGFHMGDNYIAIDLAMPSDAEKEALTWKAEPLNGAAYGGVTWEIARNIEAEANRVIWEDAPVTRSFFGTRDDAVKLPLRKALKIEKDISVITVGETADPYDQVACCGTHPSSSGQVGLIKVLRIEPNKGMSRVYLEAGKRAFDLMRESYDKLYDIAVSISAGVDDVKQKFEANRARAEKEHEELYSYRQKMTSIEAGDLLSKALSGKGVIKEEYDMPTDDILSIVKKFDKELGDQKLPDRLTVALVSIPENTLVLRSDTVDTGKLIKENAPSFNGKGGGKPSMARARFEKASDLAGFIESLKTE